MSREVHVRFWERAAVQSRRATHLPVRTTALGWQVSDISLAIRELANRGVLFERYPEMTQDPLGVWRSPSGAHVAWFKDPDGNTLSLTQFAA